MWLGGQQTRPVDPGEGQTGTVTTGGGDLAVLLDSERRGVEVYAPAGYRWSPEPGQRVLVIQGRGEIPCVVGARQDGGTPDKVDIQARRLALEGNWVGISGHEGAGLQGERVSLDGEVYVNGEKLEELIARIVMELLGGG